jgi:hypothetical protein
MNTGISGAPESHPISDLRFDASDGAHYFKLVNTVRFIGHWRCVCQETLTQDLRGHTGTDGGEWKIVQAHWNDLRDAGREPGTLFRRHKVGGVADYFEAECVCGWFMQQTVDRLRQEMEAHKSEH